MSAADIDSPAAEMIKDMESARRQCNVAFEGCCGLAGQPHTIANNRDHERPSSSARCSRSQLILTEFGCPVWPEETMCTPTHGILETTTRFTLPVSFCIEVSNRVR